MNTTQHPLAPIWGVTHDRESRITSCYDRATIDEEDVWACGLDGLLWDEVNEAHIARHGVIIEEVEEAVFDRASLPLRTTGPEDRLRYIFGQSDAGRYLFVVVEPLAEGQARPVTARDMTDAERIRYKGR